MQLSAADAATAAKPTASLNSTQAQNTYDTFMTLFLTQLKYQDPTQPMDPSETVAQLAIFSQVEQLVQSNARLDALILNSSLTQAASFIGKTIDMNDGTEAGKVKSVMVDGARLVATFEDGRSAEINSSVTIS